MTSINDLQRDLETVSDSVLAGLDAEDRVSMFAKALGDRDAPDGSYADQKTEWLRDTIPAETHAEYREKMLVALGLSRSATYNLHMDFMEYRLANQKAQQEVLRSLAMPEMYGGDPDEDSAVAETLEDLDLEPLDYDKIMEQLRGRVKTAATGMYIEYHANKRFANEVLDVTLEEFLALSPSGRLDHVDLGAVLDRAEEKDQIADPSFADENGDVVEMTLEDAVETLYQDIVRNWSGELEEGEL